MDFNSITPKYRSNRYLRYILYALILLFAIFLSLRGSIVKSIFEHKCASIYSRYGLAVKADKIGFSGIRTVLVEKLSAIPEQKDTLFCIDKAEVKLSIADLALLRVNPLEISLTNPKINLVGERDSSNYSFLLSSKKDTLQFSEPTNEGNTRHLNALNRMLKGLFGLTTANYHISNFTFSYKDSTYSTIISMPQFESNSKGINTQIDVKEDGHNYSVKLTGKTDKSNNSIHFKAFRVGSKTPLPLLYHKFGVNLAFDTADFKITANRLSSKNINLDISSSVKSLELFIEKLSDQTVTVNQGSLDFHINLNDDNYHVDSTSTVDINGLKANIYINYLPFADRYLAFKVSTGEFPSQQLFDALPEGLFTNIKGIKTTGNINYSLEFGASLNEPDSIILKPILKTKNFSITQYGNKNFAALNDTFSHAAYNEYGYVKTIHIGPKNREYRRLDQISPFIANAVITSEDGGFYYNPGFDIDALKYAISENIKQKRFARGGSTITMQLIKNLYLNQHKNIFRKAEEYIIVWLIEGHRLVPKERLLEIYLNIIEWGPNVYGVTEACQYYFKKNPADVTLDEAIYLASIVPRPTKFKYLFEKDGYLKSFMEDDFKFVSNKMLLRGMITEDQLNQLNYNVTLTGNAKDLLSDTTVYSADSISVDEIKMDRDSSLLLP